MLYYVHKGEILSQMIHSLYLTLQLPTDKEDSR